MWANATLSADGSTFSELFAPQLLGFPAIGNPQTSAGVPQESGDPCDIRSGYRWISGLVDMIERTFTGNRSNEDARNSAILEQANATIMRQYGHWIESIEFEGKAQTDLDTLDMLIDTLAQDKNDRSKVFQAVADFIDDVTVAVIAIPEANGKEVGPKRFARLIPIDAVTTFFSLLMQRTNQILAEEE